MATGPEEYLFVTNFLRRGVDCMPEENLFLAFTLSGLRAFDTHSGAQRWQHPQGGVLDWGGESIVMAESPDLFLIDKATGRELWRCREDQYGRIVNARLSHDGSRLLALFSADPDGGTQRYTTVLYDTETRGRRVFGDMPDAFPVAFLPDGKTALFIRLSNPAKASVPAGSRDLSREFFLMDLDSGRASEGHAIPDAQCGPWGSLSASGLFAMVCPWKDGVTGLRIFDTRTGSLVRDLGDIPEHFSEPAWSADEKCLYFITYDQKKACVLDAQTGAIQQTLSRPGHTLLRVRIQRPMEGPDMVLSHDEDRNVWYWPPTPDAAPARVFDGRRIAPDSLVMKFENGGHLSAYNRAPGKTLLSTYRVKGMEKTGEWRLPGRDRFWGGLFNLTMTHCAVNDSHGDGRLQSTSVEVYARDAETPLFSGTGVTLALSPDGRFLVIQTEGKRALLQDLQEKRTIGIFDAKSEWDTGVEASFSDDGRRVAVNAWPALEVVDIAEGFPRRSMTVEAGQRGFNCTQNDWNHGHGQSLCFSPDGTLLLSGAYGRAWLHDAGTGALLRTFTEPKRFLETQGRGDLGLKYSLEQTARDWAGMVTDRYKGSGSIQVAFAGRGDRVITHAAGQVVRVWDSRSGELLHTIETGLPEKRNKYWTIRNHIILGDNGDYAFAYNSDNFGTASLWSLEDGGLARRYRFPDSPTRSIALADDARSVYVLDRGELERWAGRDD